MCATQYYELFMKTHEKHSLHTVVISILRYIQLERENESENESESERGEVFGFEFNTKVAHACVK